MTSSDVANCAVASSLIVVNLAEAFITILRVRLLFYNTDLSQNHATMSD